MLKNLENLISLARQRKKNPKDNSYTNKLLNDTTLSKSKVLEEINELIEAIEFQIPQKSNYQKFPNPASRYAIVGVYVAKFKGNTNVAITGAKSCVYKDKDLSNALSKNFSSSIVDSIKISPKDMNSDIHASPDYRANMIKIFAKKAVEAC